MARACEFCRRRKIKCDATKPSCSTCRVGGRVCVYQNGPQKQRPSAARIDSLEGERAALEDALVRLKGADEEQRRALLDSVVVRDGRVSVAGAVPGPVGPGWDRQRGLSGSGGSGGRSGLRTSGGDVDVIHGEDNTNDNYGDPGLGSYEKDAGAIDEPSSDTIFSSTSVVHTSSPARTLSLDKDPASTEALRYQLIANAAMERQREHRLRRLPSIRGTPGELALHLLDLHWSRQHHTFLLTYRPTFMRELEHGGPYCSDLLLYAVFACASKFSERLELRGDPADPETAGQHYFNRCDELLLREGLLAQSSISTVIALVMLGSTFIARGLTSKGWLYTGYAMRMVYDLGLHVDPQEHNKHNIEEVEIRRRVFWGAFVCEKLQSLYLGRPPTIRLQDVHVSQQFLDTFEEMEAWEPYDDYPAHRRLGSGTGTVTMASSATAHSVTVFQQLCRLGQIMTQIIDKMYFVGASASKTLHEVRPLDELLTAWYRDLPTHLAYEPWKNVDTPFASVAPNRIIILTTYHALIVLLHRPFITTPSATTTTSNSTIGTSSFSWKRCTTASRHITSLVLAYQSIYPLRKSSYLLSYAVYVACTIHVLNTASLSAGSDGSSYAESSSLLSASLKCLDALAVPNSGVADTARIIRKLMVAKGVREVKDAPAPVDVQDSAPDQIFENGWQVSNASPMFNDIEQMQPFQDIFLPGQDLLFGFMNENMSLGNFDLDDTIS
ncbi:fungal-specific transcription factor domain-containing protein [Aspergillus californicus]